MKALNGFLLLLSAQSLCDPNAKGQFTALTLNLRKKDVKNLFMVYVHEPAIVPHGRRVLCIDVRCPGRSMMGMPTLRVHQYHLGHEVHHRGEAAERNTNNSASQHSGLALIYGHLYKTPKKRQKAISVLLWAISISMRALRH